MQAIARAFRIGQTRQVTVFKYVTQKTVEMVQPTHHVLFSSMLLTSTFLEHREKAGTKDSTRKDFTGGFRK